MSDIILIQDKCTYYYLFNNETSVTVYCVIHILPKGVIRCYLFFFLLLGICLIYLFLGLFTVIYETETSCTLCLHVEGAVVSINAWKQQ